MSDLKMRRKLQEATELADDIDKAADRLLALPRRTKEVPIRIDGLRNSATRKTLPLGFDDGIEEDLAREDSDAPSPPQLNTDGGSLPLRKIPMCEFCYMNMRPTDHSQFCVEHDMGGHKACYQLHTTTVHL